MRALLRFDAVSRCAPLEINSTTASAQREATTQIDDSKALQTEAHLSKISETDSGFKSGRAFKHENTPEPELIPGLFVEGSTLRRAKASVWPPSKQNDDTIHTVHNEESKDVKFSENNHQNHRYESFDPSLALASIVDVETPEQNQLQVSVPSNGLCHDRPPQTSNIQKQLLSPPRKNGTCGSNFQGEDIGEVSGALMMQTNTSRDIEELGLKFQKSLPNVHHQHLLIRRRFSSLVSSSNRKNTTARRSSTSSWIDRLESDRKAKGGPSTAMLCENLVNRSCLSFQATIKPAPRSFSNC